MDNVFIHIPESLSYGGPCAECGRKHALAAAPALDQAAALFRAMQQAGRMDFETPDPDPRLSLDSLWGPARGKMFGVLVHADSQGGTGVLKAFSSQYNGVWQVAGWVDPVMDADLFARLSDPVDREIKELGREIDALDSANPERTTLMARRRQLSQELMLRLHALYTLTNFRGETRPLADFFAKGVPTGAADCCTPKLLHHAALHGLTPLGVAEFYVGRTNASKTRVHGHCYPPCRDKCLPILGFQLCGLGTSITEERTQA